ncbi:MAG: PorT family protein [Muribaculaceae bacterium]|nr:PorT family protein [Muribaculaceae bacterium]
MKKTLLLSLLCMILAMPAMAQPGYRYGRGYNPRVQTVGRHGNEYIAWHSYYVGLRVGLNASHVSSESPLFDGSSVKSGLNIGIAAGTQLSYRAPLFIESGLYYSQKGGKSDSGSGKFTYDLNYLEVPLIIKYKHFVGYQTSIQPYAGGYLAVATDGQIKNYGTRTAFSSYDDGYFNRFDGGLKIGCGVGYNMLYLDASYDIGLANIGQDNFDDTHNGCFTINLGVNF